MARSRLVLHPMLGHHKSRLIFIWFLSVGVVVGGLLWWRFDAVTTGAGINLYYGPPSPNKLLYALLSPHFRFTLILLAAIFAAGITAQHVVGPVKRILDWAQSWERGEKLNPLRVRLNDKFSVLADLLNKAYERRESLRRLR